MLSCIQMREKCFSEYANPAVLKPHLKHVQHDDIGLSEPVMLLDHAWDHNCEYIFSINQYNQNVNTNLGWVIHLSMSKRKTMDEKYICGSNFAKIGNSQKNTCSILLIINYIRDPIVYLY